VEIPNPKIQNPNKLKFIKSQIQNILEIWSLRFENCLEIGNWLLVIPVLRTGSTALHQVGFSTSDYR